jgi:Metallo-beta-lactamase superfamily
MAKKSTSRGSRTSEGPTAPTPARRSRKSASARVPAVRVRMYRQGLGDCFLLTFDVGGEEKHVLIDFGTLGTKATQVKMPDVIESIKKTTDGKLAILVATHAHQDHVSGFLSQQAALKTFKIQNVWMPWTEDPNDALARQLGNKATAMRNAIANALGMPQARVAGVSDKIGGMASFEALSMDEDTRVQFDEAGIAFDGTLGMGDSITRALDVLRNFPGAKTTYHSPGPPAVELPEIPGFVFYVLGPPRDAAKLQNMDNNASDELYGLMSAVNAQAAAGFDLQLDDEAPFDERFCYPTHQADQFFPEYGQADQSYRRIDDQWFRAVAELAAKLDDFRNNTSLALAIERIADRKVLLFPADAQEGNWLSWHDQPMTWKSSSSGTIVTAADLLERTVFYKVGHHSSHNATAKGKGLEIMRKNKQLTAFIPVDRAIALKRSPPGSWRMPAFELYRALLEACDGRVARADLGWAAEAKGINKADVEGAFIGLGSSDDWNRWTASQKLSVNVEIGNIFIQYLLN